MPVKFSDLVISDEKWASMTEEERLDAIRKGRINSKRLAEIEKDGSDAERAALSEYLKERGKNVASRFQTVMGGSGLRNAFDDLLKPSAFDRPIRVDLPRVQIPRIPSASEIHAYESAGVLIRRLKERYKVWVEKLPADVQPVIYVVLANGVTIKAFDFEEEGHNGVAVYGEVDGGTCWVMTHQAGLQLIWVGEKVEEASPRRTIGFRTMDDSAASAGG